jgi:hypothetical protein
MEISKMPLNPLIIPNVQSGSQALKTKPSINSLRTENRKEKKKTESSNLGLTLPYKKINKNFGERILHFFITFTFNLSISFSVENFPNRDVVKKQHQSVRSR